MNGKVGPLGIETPPQNSMLQALITMQTEIATLQDDVRELKKLRSTIAMLQAGHMHLDQFVQLHVLPAVDALGADGLSIDWRVGVETANSQMFLNMLEIFNLIEWSLDGDESQEVVAKIYERASDGLFVAFVSCHGLSPLAEKWHLATRCHTDKGKLIREVLILQMRQDKKQLTEKGEYTDAMLGIKAPVLDVVK